MTRYYCTSPSSTLILTYDDEGLLVKLECEKGINGPHMNWIYDQKLFFEENTRNLKNTSIRAEKVTISFDDFWNKYAYKKDLQGAKKAWEKTSEENRLLAFKGIKRFMLGYGGIGQPPKPPYAERYLKDKRWEDED